MTNKDFLPLIQVEELIKLLHANENFILIDAGSGSDAFERYQKTHLKNAIYVDLNKDLSAIRENPANGGRHPLPNIKTFATLIGNLGIQPQSRIVVYDDKKGTNAAARFWWMLKAIGHEKVQVLNGGFSTAVKHNYPCDYKIPSLTSTQNYLVTDWKLSLSHINEVEEVAQNKNYTIIDVRESERYKGEKEPIDLIAGHIPGAINIPYTTNLDEEGLFLNPETLKEKYKPIFTHKKPENIIIHCGSGVTACHTLLAINYAGFDIPKLYIGSWSEWSRNDKEIGLGE